MYTLHKSRGFTLIELLVVIGIIGLLATVVLGSMSISRVKARDTTRVSQLKTLETMLNLYFSDMGQYPATYVGGGAPTAAQVRQQCFGYSLDYIPLISTKYNITLPTDPKLDCPGRTYSFSYASNGTDYKLVTHPEADNPGLIKFMDPATDGGANKCLQDGTDEVHYGVWSVGGACWRI